MKRRKIKLYTKKILTELRNTILFEVIWNIILWIPRLVIRLLKHLW